MIGERIHSYEINAHLGQGGMGNVFKATDSMLDREVALKVLHPQLTVQPLFLERFKKEARVLAQLLHPNIAVIYNFFEQDGNHFMVMEYVKGTSLDDLLKKHKVLPASFVVPAFIQALEGLQHAHRKNIFHRDIKPANLMLTSDGILKLMDFGIAKIAGEQKLTQVNKIIGTIEFMAPELIEGKEASVTSDIYSMGATLYELVSGKIPFEGTTDFSMMQSILKSRPKSPDKINHHIPRSLNDIILKAMDRQAEQRYPNAKAFQQALINAFPNFREIDLNVLKTAQQPFGAEKQTTVISPLQTALQNVSVMQTSVDLAKPLANFGFYKRKILSNKKLILIIVVLLLIGSALLLWPKGDRPANSQVAVFSKDSVIHPVESSPSGNNINTPVPIPQTIDQSPPEDKRITLDNSPESEKNPPAVNNKKEKKTNDRAQKERVEKESEVAEEVIAPIKNPEPERKEIYINRPVIIKLSLSSSPDMNQKKKTDQAVNFSVAEAVYFDGVMIIKAGATAKGTLTIGSRKTDIRINHVEAANGTVINVKSVNEHGRRDDIESKKMFTAEVQPGVKLIFN